MNESYGTRTDGVFLAELSKKCFLVDFIDVIGCSQSVIKPVMPVVRDSPTFVLNADHILAVLLDILRVLRYSMISVAGTMALHEHRSTSPDVREFALPFVPDFQRSYSSGSDEGVVADCPLFPSGKIPV